MSNEMTAVSNIQEIRTLRGMLEKGKEQLAAAAASHMDPDRMIRLALTAASKNRTLFKCSPGSIGLALLTASQLGIEPDGRNGHLVPYWNGKAKQYDAQFIPDYKGLVALALREPGVLAFEARSVRCGDFFEYEFGSSPFLRHRKAPEGRGDLEFAYAVCWMEGRGQPTFEVMTREEVLKRRDCSESWKNEEKRQFSPWFKWDDEMWAKTAVKLLSKFLPIGGNFQRAVEHENQIEGGEFGQSAVLGIDDDEGPQNGNGRLDPSRLRAGAPPDQPTGREPPKPPTSQGGSKGRKPSPEAAGIRKMLEGKGLTEDALIEHLGSEGEECQGIDAMDKKQRGMATKWIAGQGNPKSVQPSMI